MSIKLYQIYSFFILTWSNYAYNNYNIIYRKKFKKKRKERRKEVILFIYYATYIIQSK